MAEKTTPVEEFVMVSDGTAEPETKIVMEVFGDTFTGNYLGMRNVPSADGGYQQARFESDGETFFINANFSLKDGLKSVRNGAKTRITYVHDLDTGQLSPMRVYTIEVARVTRASNRPSS
jgi:hypothetical protein